MIAVERVVDGSFLLAINKSELPCKWLNVNITSWISLSIEYWKHLNVDSFTIMSISIPLERVWVLVVASAVT